MILCRGREGETLAPIDLIWSHLPVVYDESEGGCPMCRVYERLLGISVRISEARLGIEMDWEDRLPRLMSVVEGVSDLINECDLSVLEVTTSTMVARLDSRRAFTEMNMSGTWNERDLPDDWLEDNKQGSDFTSNPSTISRVGLIMDRDPPPEVTRPTKRRRKKKS